MAARSSPRPRRTASPGGSGRSSPAAASARPAPAPNGSGPAPARTADARIALVAATIDEVARVMVEGESGLLALARCDEAPALDREQRPPPLPLGRRGPRFSAERPEELRGPQHHYAWCDELAKWPAHRTGHQGRRHLGQSHARPAPGRAAAHHRHDHAQARPLLQRILALPRCVPTHGRTDENPHLPRRFHRSDARDVRRHPPRPPGARRPAARGFRRRPVDPGAAGEGAGTPSPAGERVDSRRRAG